MKILFEIENTNALIKEKDNSLSFNETGLNKFELVYFMAMDIVRYELMKEKQLSDLTSEIISQLFAFQCFEYYYRDFPQVYTKTTELFSLLCDYNICLRNNDLKGNIGASYSNWQLYFNQILSRILTHADTGL